MRHVILGLVIILLSSMIYASSLPSLEGVYLTDGIQGLLQIESNAISFNAKVIFGEHWGTSVKVIKETDDYILIPIYIDASRLTVMRVKPSMETRGDWDLTGMVFEGNKALEKDVIQNIKPLTRIVPSYLHRIKDPRIIQYIENHRIADPKSMLALARNILKDFPNDAYIRAIYLDALSRNKEWEELAAKNALWRADFENSPNLFLKRVPRQADHFIEYHKLSSMGQNAYDYIEQISPIQSSKRTSHEELLTLLEKASACKASIPRPLPMTMSYYNVPNFLEGQVASKVIRVEAIFAMIRGENPEALHLLKLTYRYGQIFCGKTTLISNLIGTAIKAIACAGMEIYILNACQTPQEAKEFFDTLSSLKKIDETLHWEDFIFYENPVLELLPPNVLPNLGDAKVRMNSAEAKFCLLLAAAAARYLFLSSGKFPITAADFAPFLPDGLPQDPFSAQPLRFTPNREPFMIYSIGPDEMDDKATVVYDPTNGTISAGDIFIEMPRKRKYPFPTKGQLAATKDDILKQFPKDLPPDPFHDTRNAPLSITDETPARIFSFGPNHDSNRVKDGKGLLPLEPPYDPTNGTVSIGDLIMLSRP